MSQASKVLKEIAGREEYQALAKSVEAADYEAMAKYYPQLARLLEEKKKEILDKIRSLPRQNQEECQKFETAWEIRAGTTLPQWHRLYTLLKEGKVTEGEVFGVGSKGDPLVRTPAGRVVVIAGSKLEKGARVIFQTVTEGDKIDFGRVYEFTPNSFYFLLNRGTLTGLRSLLDAVGDQLRSRAPINGLAELGGLLTRLEEARQLADKVDPVEKEKTIARIMNYRRALLVDNIVKLSFRFLSERETKELGELYVDNGEQLTQALAAPGLFRREAHATLRAGLFDGAEPKSYGEMLKNLESKLDSMNAALELMEFKSGIEKVSESARKYLDLMDQFYENLYRKARQLGQTLAEGKTCQEDELRAAIESAFSGPSLRAEFRRFFRSNEDFYTLRAALIELKVQLGDKEIALAEAAFKPYLNRKVEALSGKTNLVAS